ncbi:MAG: YbjN domain-containing protein [Candidatus Thiodiazotropha sp. (ex Lucinoma borealis)]|nr:YbjN domain-containing protein [Candidatus Thiodiazotropha sp. (ex Lucinoma borealis)]
MDMITTENVSPQSLNEIFDAAFMDCVLDENGHLTVQGKYTYYVLLESGNKFIRLLLHIRPREGASVETCRHYCERVNAEMIVLRLAPVNGNESIGMEWHVSLTGGITPKHLVLCFKEYDELIQDALQRGAEGVF